MVTDDMVALVPQLHMFARSLCRERTVVWVVEDLQLAGRSELQLLSALRAVASDGSLFTYDNLTVTVSR